MQLGLWKFLIKIGKQIVSRYRVELVPLLIPQEIEMLAIQSVLRMNTRKDFESKLIYNISEDKRGNYNLRE